MEYQVLARKWRPKTFKEVIGQNHIVKTLKNSIAQDRVAHAYLFTGTRGVGKTTVARILAKSLRCQNLTDGEPCLVCDSCQSIENGNAIDYTEIDGASNNGVENIRDLVENVHYLPSSGKYKVYVIDEVHMLSTGAFNALLKTLEEPPAHVIFIFATTDPQKLLATVISRCQRMDFKYVSMADLITHVQKIAHSENIKFENEELVVEICKQGRGSIRDTLSLLDQVLSMSPDKKISSENFYMSLGLAEKEVLKNIVSNILKGNVDKVVEDYQGIVSRNIELKSFIQQLLSSLHLCLADIGNPSKLYKEEVLVAESMDTVDYAEMFWIYEAIAKDADWILKSIDPLNILEVSLRKITMRRELLTHNPSVEKKNSQTVIKEEPKDWPGFIRHAYKNAAATAANLERGNVLEKINLESDPVEVKLAFEGSSAQVFMDYLMESETNNKVKMLLKDYYQTEKVFKLNFISLNAQETKEKNFLSQATINSNIEEQVLMDRKSSIRNNSRVVEAVKLFGSDIDKVVLNEAKK